MYKYTLLHYMADEEEYLILVDGEATVEEELEYKEDGFELDSKSSIYSESAILPQYRKLRDL